jgi:hypothetical protein
MLCLGLMSTELTTIATTTPLVVQHNALVNARFSLSALETRLFLAMLSYIGRDDSAFEVCRIPVRELAPDSNSNSLYAEVREMTRTMATRALHIEPLGPNGERMKEPDLLNRPLMGRCDYLKKEGVVEARFNEDIRPYLLELKSNFTKAQVSQLLKIKSPASSRIYWLLREYAAFGKRTMSLTELRNVLSLTTEYADRFDHFRVRVLDRAKMELAATDLPFTYELIKEGRTVTEIRFLFAPAPPALPLSLPPVEAWKVALQNVGIEEKSLAKVRAQLEAGHYDEGYIHYVLKTVQTQVEAGKVKKAAGAIFTALTDGYMLPDYKKAQAGFAGSAQKAKISPTIIKKREKLENELADAKISLDFVQTSSAYTDQTRPAALSQVQAQIAGLQQQLAALRG